MQSPIRLLFWALLWAGLAAPVQGEVYRWEDAQGNVHFGDRPPAGAATEALQRRLRRLPIPVIGRIAQDRLLLDLRCLDDEQALLESLQSLEAA